LNAEKGSKRGKVPCTKTYTNNAAISIERPEKERLDFLFDRVLDPSSDQQTSYSEIADPVVNDVLNGFNGVIMAYG
jgi:hypothetical protein